MNQVQVTLKDREYNAADPITLTNCATGVEHSSQTLPHRVIDGHQLLGVAGATECEIKGLELIIFFWGTYINWVVLYREFSILNGVLMGVPQ